MNFIDSLQEELNSVLTENHDKAYLSSGSYCLDYFALIGGMRHNYYEIISVFMRAFFEDKIMAIKLLFYTRDIRNGLGERNTFRMILNFLACFYPDVATQILKFIPEYGRYDDYLVCLNTPIHDEVIKLLKTQLDEDLALHQAGKEISLLAKWLPSINTSNKANVKLAKQLAKSFELTNEEYRKTLSSLRKGRIIENNLRKRDYSFDYQKQTSQSLLKYRQAFLRNDADRYLEYIDEVNNSRAKINTSTLYPYQVIKPIIYNPASLTKESRLVLDTTWNNLPRVTTESKTIVVRDGSYSMYRDYSAAPIDIATSLAILFSEQLPEPFKNHFITFSENPRLIKLPNGDIYDKVQYSLNFYEAENTNISKVYQLILDVAQKNNVAQEDMINQIIIISDMEFDGCVEDQSSYEVFKEKFANLGYKFPQVVFWNVDARTVHLPVKSKDENVILISGSSSKVFDMVVNSKFDNQSAYDFMIEVLEKYSQFNNLSI